MTVVKRTVKSDQNEEDIQDPVENMLKKTGCIELHYKVQECIAATQDWRKCQTAVQEFKECIERNKLKSMRP